MARAPIIVDADEEEDELPAPEMERSTRGPGRDSGPSRRAEDRSASFGQRNPMRSRASDPFGGMSVGFGGGLMERMMGGMGMGGMGGMGGSMFGDDMFEDFGMGMGGSSQVSFSSSSFSGGNGVTYSSSTTTRIGPGGVRETQSSVKDGRTGKESLTMLCVWAFDVLGVGSNW